MVEKPTVVVVADGLTVLCFEAWYHTTHGFLSARENTFQLTHVARKVTHRAYPIVLGGGGLKLKMLSDFFLSFLVELDGTHVQHSCGSLHALALKHESASSGRLLAGHARFAIQSITRRQRQFSRHVQVIQ
jgi:hypothetical protein